MHLAFQEGHIAVVQALRRNDLEKGGNILKTRDAFGRNLLHWLMMMNRPDMAKILINMASKDECKVLFSPDNKGHTPLIIAIQQDALEIVELLLDKASTSKLRQTLLCADHEGQTALHKAVCEGKKEIFTLLLERAEIREATLLMKPDKQGRRPFHWNAEDEDDPIQNAALTITLCRAVKWVKEMIPDLLKKGQDAHVNQYMIDVRNFLHVLKPHELSLAACHIPSLVAELLFFYDANQIAEVIPKLSPVLLAQHLKKMEQSIWPLYISACTALQKERLLAENLLKWPKEITYYQEAWKNARKKWEESDKDQRLPIDDFKFYYSSCLLENHPSQAVEAKIAEVFNKEESSEAIQDLLQQALKNAVVARAETLEAINTWVIEP